MFKRWLCWWEKGGGGDRDPGGGVGGGDKGNTPGKPSYGSGGWFDEDLSSFDTRELNEFGSSMGQ